MKLRTKQISLPKAVAQVKQGMTLMSGGFGMTGNPIHLLHALAETDIQNLTFIGNNIGSRL